MTDKRIAVRMDKKTYDYIQKIAKAQKTSFSAIAASMLMAIREDDEKVSNRKFSPAMESALDAVSRAGNPVDIDDIK